jgi:hypothetical protein
MKGYKMSKIKFQKGELISYAGNHERRLGIVVSDPFYSNGRGWQVKTYCDGNVYKESVNNISKVCDDVQLIKNPIAPY